MDKIYKIPKYNKELYLGGTLMKDLKNFVKPILFLTIGLLLISLVKNIDFMSMMTKIQNNMQQGLTVVKITDEKSEIKDDNLNIKFKVPSIHYNDKEVEKSINSYIKKNIKEYINVQRQINKMNKYSEKYVVNITYNVVFEDENSINIEYIERKTPPHYDDREKIKNPPPELIEKIKKQIMADPERCFDFMYDEMEERYYSQFPDYYGEP